MVQESPGIKSRETPGLLGEMDFYSPKQPSLALSELPVRSHSSFDCTAGSCAPILETSQAGPASGFLHLIQEVPAPHLVRQWHIV